MTGILCLLYTKYDNDNDDGDDDNNNDTTTNLCVQKYA